MKLSDRANDAALPPLEDGVPSNDYQSVCWRLRSVDENGGHRHDNRRPATGGSFDFESAANEGRTLTHAEKPCRDPWRDCEGQGEPSNPFNPKRRLAAILKRRSTLGPEAYVFGTEHGITREVKLDLIFQGADTDPWGNERAGAEIEGFLHRQDFDMKFIQALGSGNLLVGDKVRIAIEISAIRKK